MDHDEEDRITAVNRHLKGDKATDICKDMNRSKSWFFKWINKFNCGGEEWYKSQSTAPKNHGGKINKEIGTAVISIRKTLMDGNEHESKYLGVGADTIQYRMQKSIFQMMKHRLSQR